MFQSEINADGDEKSAYANAGYDSSVYFMLLGPIFFVVVLYISIMLLKKLLQLLTIKMN